MNEEFWALLDHLVYISEIVIDRPKGSIHPNWPKCIYPVDYGYLSNTSSQDKDGVDIWIGSAREKTVVGIITIVDIMKRDSEIKILYGCTKEEVNEIYQFHNSTKGMRGLLSIR